ncbi:MAG: AraC family transcriptional regulator [Deltaproteobacteria bacterium]|nr:AraC family transcriptional regulator [Deltaproteobacteria bacterium]
MATQWEKRKAVDRMQEAIEQRLGEPITLAQLAHAARYSPYYAARIFKELTGRTPFEHIRLRRLSAAAMRLASSDDRVIDVAFDFVFDSHEGFTRAFSKCFGLTPAEFRRTRPEVPLFLPASARGFYSRRLKGETTMTDKSKPSVVFVQILERPERRMILKRGKKATHYFEYCEEVGCDIWKTLSSIESAIHEPMGLWLPDKLRPEGTSKYVQGVELPKGSTAAVPEGFEAIDLPPCRMLVFQGPPFKDDDFEEAIGSLWDAINAYDPASIGYGWADDEAPRFQLQPMGYRGYIEGRPVRAR